MPTIDVDLEALLSIVDALADATVALGQAQAELFDLRDAAATNPWSSDSNVAQLTISAFGGRWGEEMRLLGGSFSDLRAHLENAADLYSLVDASLVDVFTELRAGSPR